MQLKDTPPVYGHSFDLATGIHLLPVRVFPEPDGSCPLPDNTVDFPPTEKTGPNQAWRINAERTAWELVHDFRYVMLWDKRSATPAPNGLALDELPHAHLTVLPPPTVVPGTPARNAWSEQLGAWVQVPYYSQTPTWDKASGAALPPMAPGEPLPATATDQAPPRDGEGPWRYSDVQGRWEAKSLPELVKPQPHPPEPTNDAAAD